MRAYCFASGQIEFGRSVPDGALQIAEGPAKQLRDWIEGWRATDIAPGRRTDARRKFPARTRSWSQASPRRRTNLPRWTRRGVARLDREGPPE
jgi:hypothetical protein